MRNEYTLNDQLDHLTVLYHRGCKKGFKFFGDDPEEQKYYIEDKHIEVLRSMWPIENTDYPVDFLKRFYAHSRCLIFPTGVWMSETARYPQYLRFRPGANLSFRVSGLTRFTSLTDGGSALCVGVDPDANEMPCYKRFIHVIETSKATTFEPTYNDSYLIPTENCVYGKEAIREGKIIKANQEPLTLCFQKKGYMIEYTKEPFTMEEAVLNYGLQWATKHIEVFHR